MRHVSMRTAAGLALLLGWGWALAAGPQLKATDPRTGKAVEPVKAPAKAEPAVKETGECSGHGTAVQFYDTPSEAAKHAKKEEKLVFVLHVSGNFENPDFT